MLLFVSLEDDNQLNVNKSNNSARGVALESVLLFSNRVSQAKLWNSNKVANNAVAQLTVTRMLLLGVALHSQF